MSTPDDPNRPERPRVEPEIIPPDRRDQRARSAAEWTFIRFDERDGVQRINITRPSLPAIIIALLALGLIAAFVVLIVAGVVLLWIPFVVVAIVLALLSGAIRANWRRLQAWWAGRN